MKPKVIGDVARYAQTQRREAGRCALKWDALMWFSFGAMLMSAWMGVTRWLDGGDGAFLFLLAGIFVGLGVWGNHRGKEFHQIKGRQGRGVNAEAEVVKVLRRQKGVVLIMNGVDAGAGGDADHVVVMQRAGQGVVAVIETKAGGGEVVSDGQGGLFSGRNRRRIPGNPVRQVARQARGVQRRTGVAAHGVVCVPGMATAPFIEQNVVVCGAVDLPGVLSSRLSQRPMPADLVEKLPMVLPLKA